ncbi:MAG: peptide ABC transporter substrate-binding protein [Chloroflexota bacterium]
MAPKTTTPPASPPPPGKGTLVLYGTDPLTLDPAVSGEMTSHTYILQLYSGLVKLDKELKPTPDIAREWRVSPDGKTYTFELRQNARFHDGRAVKAEDFKYSWERALNPQTESTTAGTYLIDIVGAADMLAGRSRELAGVRVLGDYTLQVTIDAPKSYFLSKLTYPTAFVVDKNNVASGGREWWRKPNGTGVFKLRQWEKEKVVILEQNRLYYGTLARLEFVQYNILSGVPMNLYETGKIDVTGVGVEYIDRVTDKSEPFHRELQKVPELSFYYIGFNHTKPPFDDINIRRAFALSVNKERLVSLIYKNTSQPARGILPPGIPGYNPDLAGLGYDIQKAKELLSASRYGDASRLPPITITAQGWGGLIGNEVEAIIQEWRQNLGVEVKVRQLEPERFLYRLRDEKDEMFITGWIADYPHPQNFLELLFRTGQENNSGDYRNPEVDRLLEMAGVEKDAARSLALYRQAEEKIVSDVACIPLWTGLSYTLVKPYVSGYQVSPLGIPYLGEVTVNR